VTSGSFQRNSSTGSVHCFAKNPLLRRSHALYGSLKRFTAYPITDVSRESRIGYSLSPSREGVPSGRSL